MIDPNLAWFTAGTLLGAVLFGWMPLNMERYDRLNDGHVRRRRGATPPPGRKPAPPTDWRRSFNHENINSPTGEPPLKWRQREQEEGEG